MKTKLMNELKKVLKVPLNDFYINQLITHNESKIKGFFDDKENYSILELNLSSNINSKTKNQYSK